MKIANVSLAAVILFLFNTGIHAQTDYAPSGSEQSEAWVNGRSTVLMPGKDSPVQEQTQGNRTTLDFDQGEHQNAQTVDDHNPNNITIHYDNNDDN
ncbi:hypothetical protein [Paraburkholderia strydomiana]